MSSGRRQKALTSLNLSEDGRYLYCVANGCNNVAVFSVDQETGTIALIQNQPINGKKARNGTLSPDGRFFITACILDGEIDVFSVGEDGMLTPTENHAKAHGAAYISFYDPKKTK
jgi:6-phosphogluconolactonase